MALVVYGIEDSIPKKIRNYDLIPDFLVRTFWKALEVAGESCFILQCSSLSYLSYCDSGGDQQQVKMNHFIKIPLNC